MFGLQSSYYPAWVSFVCPFARYAYMLCLKMEVVIGNIYFKNDTHMYADVILGIYENYNLTLLLSVLSILLVYFFIIIIVVAGI